LLVRDTQDFALLRRGIWLTLRCGEDADLGMHWKLRTDASKTSDEEHIMLHLNDLGLEGVTISECCPQIVCSMRVTRLAPNGVRRFTFASWLTFGRHGMWVGEKPRRTCSKYAACMHDCWPYSYKAAFPPEARAAHDFSALIRDPHHPLCRYHRLVTLEMAIAEHSSDDTDDDERP
jgi:hypothetical protein